MIDESDLTPNDSEAAGVYEPEVPEEVQQEDRQEENRVAMASSVSDDVIGWFESVLKDYETMDSVKKTLETHPRLTIESAFAAHYQISLEVNNLLTKFKDRFTKPEANDE